jgi:hypothetical protein
MRLPAALLRKQIQAGTLKLVEEGVYAIQVKEKSLGLPGVERSHSGLAFLQADQNFPQFIGGV